MKQFAAKCHYITEALFRHSVLRSVKPAKLSDDVTSTKGVLGK